MTRSLLTGFAVLVTGLSHGQTSLFFEDFEGPSPAFTLNTTDAGSAISPWNTWVINNSYTGGTGDVICLGFPFSYTIVDTPSQPGGISSSNGNYLHTASVEGITDGITCCSFGAADGLCITASNTFSRMSGDVSTIGYSSVDLNFWWLCEGGNTFYGQVYYSTNGGASWTATSTPSQYNFQGSWTQQTITLPAFAGQATLRFGFRFVNSVGFGALDPGFGIDDVEIIGQTGGGNSIDCSVTPAPACSGSPITVTCTATGTFNAGNIFTAQLSDALGSFAAPVAIGSIAATTSTSFGATIPPGTAAGTGYAVRVVSSDPVVTGTASATFVVNEGVNAGIDGALSVCSSGTAINMFAGIAGSPDPGGSWTDPLGNAHSGIFIPGVSVPGCYTYTVAGTAPCTDDTSIHCITESIAPDAGTSTTITVCEGDVPFPLFGELGGTPMAGGTWTAPGGAPGTGVFTPGTSLPGCYTYTVPGIAPCADASATVCVTVLPGPDAGQDATITLCKATGIYSLFNYLGGSPDAGGTWTFPSGAAFNGNFDSATDPGGDYTYAVPGSGACDTAFAVVNVVLVDQANAGNGGSVMICSDTAPVPMIGLLSGSPDITGTWYAPGGPITDPDFNPGIDVPGTYTYVVFALLPCPNDSTSLDIDVQQAPSAGSGGTFTICEDDPPVDLFTLLGGTPDTGGSWSDPGGNSITGVVDPATAPSGLYTYTVSGAPACSDDEAFLAIVFDPCSAIDEMQLTTFAWLGQIADETHVFSMGAERLVTIILHDALGRSISTTSNIEQDRLTLQMSGSPSGIYFLTVGSGMAQVTVRFMHAEVR